MKRCLLIILSIMATLSMMAGNADRVSIREAIECWMAQYPESQYCDIYKNFFQDSFGPGHILSDKDAARKYLDNELTNAEKMDGPIIEPTGNKGQFVRVNLSLIRDSIISIDDYFSAFVKSMDEIKMPTDDEWRATWSEIDAVITDMGLHFPEEEYDRQIVMEALTSGKFAVHHSLRYNAAYNRHYRIIRSDVWEEMSNKFKNRRWKND